LRPRRYTVFPYTTLFRSIKGRVAFLHERVFPPRSLKREADDESRSAATGLDIDRTLVLFDDLFGDEETETCAAITFGGEKRFERSEEHTSELQSRENLVC